MKNRIKIISVLILAATLLLSCVNGEAGDTTAPDVTDAASAAAETQTGTEKIPETTEAPATSEEVTEKINLEGPTDPAYITFEESKILKSITEKNCCVPSVVLDERAGFLLKLTTTKKTSDPYVFFNYKKYVKTFGLDPVEAGDYKYIVIKAKVENMNDSTFELFYCAGSVTSANGNCRKTVSYDNAETGWQYIVFNMSGGYGWQGALNGFRFDFSTSVKEEGESMYIACVALLKTDAELTKYIGTGTDAHALSAQDQAKAEKLIASAVSQAPAVTNAAEKAANEDATVTLWFDHSYNNTPAETVTSNGMNTYQIKLAKNEIEGCHLMLASKDEKKGLTLNVSDFKDQKGNVLEKEICYGYYFDDVEGYTVVDPIPVLEHGFDLPENQSRMFIIKVKSKTDTVPGQYKATVTLNDAQGREIKKATVYAYVWNFALPVQQTCKTLSDLNEWAVIVGANRENVTVDGLEDDLYALYYEYLLENKVNCYTLPYAKRGAYWDDRVEEYLDDPRLAAYTLTWKTTFTEEYLQAAYNRISKKQEWLDKAYFYPDKDDEPLTKAALDQIKSHDATITKIFGAHKLIIPMHYNATLDSESKTDHFEYLKDVVNVWCPHTFFYNSYADYKANPLLTYRCTAKLEQNLGTFEERMAKEQAEGDEVFWYVTRYPHDPEITLSISDESVKHRLLFWQQKLYNVDGFLYYMVNDWQNAKQWTSKHEVDNSAPYNVYGNGVLIYPGGALQEYIEKYGSDGYPGPIGSLRLESVRDGVEDYDYFVLLDKLYGEGTSELIIKQITTSLGNYSTDTDLFTTLREAVGDLIAARS